MKQSEREEILRFLRGRVIEEMMALETFRNGVWRKGIKGGCIKLEHTDGSVTEYNLRPDDDPQASLDFVQAVCHKRTVGLNELMKHYE